MASMKSYSDSELSALIKAKKKEQKENKVPSGAHTLESLLKEDQRRNGSSKNEGVSISNKNPKVQEVIDAIKAAVVANGCKTVDLLNFCARTMKTGHQLVKITPKEKSAEN